MALPKTSGAIARAIAKEYPSMRALLNAYLDSAKSVSVSFSTTIGFGIKGFNLEPHLHPFGLNLCLSRIARELGGLLFLGYNLLGL